MRKPKRRLSSTTTTLTRQDELFAEIAPIALPELKLYEATNKIRDVARYAERNAHIHVARIENIPFLDRQLFLDWAVGKWPKLAAIHTPSPVRGEVNAPLSVLQSSMIAVAGPTTLPDCQRAFAELTAQLGTVQLKLANEQAEHRKCAAVLATLERRQAATRDKKVAAGRKGGRQR